MSFFCFLLSRNRKEAVFRNQFLNLRPRYAPRPEQSFVRQAILPALIFYRRLSISY
jgi:hypothetical protein